MCLRKSMLNAISLYVIFLFVISLYVYLYLLYLYMLCLYLVSLAPEIMLVLTKKGMFHPLIEYRFLKWVRII